MSNLTRFNQDGIEILIDTETGESFATQGMLAKLCKVTSKQIAQYRGDNNSIKVLPVKTSRGDIRSSKLYGGWLPVRRAKSKK